MLAKQSPITQRTSDDTRNNKLFNIKKESLDRFAKSIKVKVNKPEPFKACSIWQHSTLTNAQLKEFEAAVARPLKSQSRPANKGQSRCFYDDLTISIDLPESKTPKGMQSTK